MKRVALINDLSGLGKCSLTAAIPVISVMGIQACPLPTAILTSQTGFGTYYCDDFTDRMDFFTDQWKQMDISFDGIYSGFLANSLQMQKVLRFLEQFEQKDTIYLADPVMGDNGQGYDVFSEELLKGMKELTRRADVITPNLTELCLLGGVDYDTLLTHRQESDYVKRIREIAENLLTKASRPQTIMVTGIVHRKNEEEFVGNLAISDKESIYLENPYTGRRFSGTGDLFASVICACMVKEIPLKEAIEKATSFLQGAIKEASAQGMDSNHGVPFEKYLYNLL